MAEQATYPMLSEKSWWTLREKFQSSIPSVVSANYVKTLLDMSSDASAVNNIIVPLKRLGLIDEENKPTPLANNWRLDDKYQETCDKIIKNIYDQELLDLFPDKDIDVAKAKTWFMGHGVGTAAAGKMVSLFALLKKGTIKSKQDRASIPSKKSQSKPKTINADNNNLKVQETTAEPTITLKQDATSRPAPNNRPNLHIDLQIHISPESTPEQIEAIFASMAKHLYGVDNS